MFSYSVHTCNGDRRQVSHAEGKIGNTWRFLLDSSHSFSMFVDVKGAQSICVWIQRRVFKQQISTATVRRSERAHQLCWGAVGVLRDQVSRNTPTAPLSRSDAWSAFEKNLSFRSKHCSRALKRVKCSLEVVLTQPYLEFAPP